MKRLLGAFRRRECTQCGKVKGIVSMREVCARCYATDKRLDSAQWELFQAVGAMLNSASVGGSIDRVEKAYNRIRGALGERL